MSCKLIEEASGKEVKSGMNVLNFRNEIYKVVDFLTPKHMGSTGRVIVVKPEDPEHKYMFYPQVFGLKIVEMQDDTTNR
jgi:hypothetical protein